MFPNKSGWVGKQVAMKSVQWGAIGSMTGQVVVKVTFWGKVTTLKEYGPIGSYGGFVMGAHAGAFASLIPSSARYYIGVYLFGRK